MRFEVLLTEDAERDLREIHEYIAANDGFARADHVLDRIEDVVDSLETFPDRGSCPKELLALGIRDYRETFWKPYRVIYRVVARRVYIYVIADGRRELQPLLTRRLLGA